MFLSEGPSVRTFHRHALSLNTSQNPENRTISNSKMQQDMKEALSKLCTSTPDQGTLGIIRAVIACPGELHQSDIQTILEEVQKYPLATIDVMHIASGQDLDLLISMASDSKRKSPFKDDGGSKRQKVDVAQ